MSTLNLHDLLREFFRFYETDRQTRVHATQFDPPACMSVLLSPLTAYLSILPLLLTACLSVLVPLLTTRRAEHRSVSLTGDVWDVALSRWISGTDTACRFNNTAVTA